MAWQGCFSQLGPEGPGLKSERRQDVHATSPYGPRDFGIRNLRDTTPAWTSSRCTIGVIPCNLDEACGINRFKV